MLRSYDCYEREVWDEGYIIGNPLERTFLEDCCIGGEIEYDGVIIPKTEIRLSLDAYDMM